MRPIQYLFTEVSQNAKTGPIPVVMASKASCPTTCGMLSKGCYAEGGPSAIHWNLLSSGANPRAIDFEQLTHRIRALPRGQLFRYGTAGDLADDHDSVIALAQAARGRKAIVYSHHRAPHMIEAFKAAADHGLHVNLSADSIDQVDALAEHGLPVVTVLRSDQTEGPYYSPAGRKIAVCPASNGRTTCAKCQVCAKPRPGGVVIGFPSHGARRKVVDRRLADVSQA